MKTGIRVICGSMAEVFIPSQLRHFECIVFEPFKNGAIEGEIAVVMKIGFHVICRSMIEVFIPSQLRQILNAFL